jgi:hypothetical protein
MAMISALLLSLALNCAAADGHHGGSHAGHKAPGGAADGGVTSLDVASDAGELFLLVGRSPKEGPSLWLRRSKDGGATWSPERRVDRGLPRPYRAGIGDARLLARGAVLTAVWSERGDGPMGTGPLVVARSTDGGLTWAAGASPDGGKGSFGRRFPALAQDGEDLHAVWIDRSDKAWLRYARSRDGGTTWSPPGSLDADMCECCWNAALAFGGRVFALYRGKGPRDMETAYSKDAGKSWTEPSVAGRFGWKVNVCPHVGGALARGGDGKVHAVVWTGAEGVEGLHHVTWDDSAGAWGKARPVGDPAARHGDLAASGRRLALVWDRGSKTGGIHAALSEDGGATWSPPRVVTKKGKGTYPRVVAVEGGFRVLWLDLDKQGDGLWRSEKL